MTDLHHGITLGDHLVRRLPTEKDLRNRKSLAVTKRDREILTSIDRHGFLTADLIDLAFFPSDRPTVRASTAAYDRLRQLWLWGLVERIELPVARVIGGSRPFLYALGRNGARLLEATSDSPARPRRIDRTSGLYVQHNLAVASFWANLVEVLRARPIGLGLWVPERDIRARQLRVKDPSSHRTWPFLPDAYFELHYATGRVQCCLLEVDLGRHSLPRMRHKLRAFEVFLAEGAFARIWQRSDFEVLFLASSEPRLNHVTNLAREVVFPERHDAYSFATVDILDPSRFGDATWRCLDGEAFGLLYTSDEDEQHGVSSTANEESAL